MPHSESEATFRRIDLLKAEQLASTLLFPSKEAQTTRVVQGERYTFLEISRFDRTPLGRKGVLSLLTLDMEFLGSGERWSVVARKLHERHLIDGETLEEIRFREYFGHLIGNNDMHLANLSFFFEEEKILGLTPNYDMLPMKYSPMQERLPTEPIAPVAPPPDGVPAWNRARSAAIDFWRKIHTSDAHTFSAGFREIALRNERVLTERGLHIEELLPRRTSKT